MTNAKIIKTLKKFKNASKKSQKRYLSVFEKNGLQDNKIGKSRSNNEND